VAGIYTADPDELSLAATICYGFYAVITRIVSRVDSNQTSLFYANCIGALVMLPVIPFVWQAPSNWVIVLLMIATGVLGSLDQSLGAVVVNAPQAIVSPMGHRGCCGDDGVDTFAGCRKGARTRQVAIGDFSPRLAQLFRLGAASAPAHERPHLPTFLAQPHGDALADESRCPDDQVHLDSFCGQRPGPLVIFTSIAALLLV